ncbi:GNAT family N-acetyltransferase [Sphingomonas bacterium]|uniref:GNAT family N-acetyltransferase n=1 Tax=Sphingomonas bacterium TaxID=1895847 RepID=UPI0026114B1E|nr:GNAT family N-acetyltransferase [Sphingomonas bacterium]MDB5678684.1 N-acetyltransferase [Sphingomonas bacterium]
MAHRDAEPDAGHMFDRFFARRAPGLRVVAEEDAHRPFLSDLFVACSPLRGMLPEPVVLQQASLRETAYRTDYPSAMRRIVLAQDRPIGRIMVDWSADDAAMLIDIAVVPDKQGAGVATAVVGAYLDVADHRRQSAALQVMRDNPALHWYARLGFAPVEAQDFAPYIDMTREPRGGD